ncbi:MAG TPA: glycosyltransferase family 1 protein [Chloroflexi bacterium]|nr:glycosyltransferase family 1 protein [Chloroflexota bacterium]
MTRLYRRERPAIVHHHTIKPVLYGTIAARLAGVPAVVNAVTGRGYVFRGEDARARGLRLLVKPVYRFALRRRGVGVIFENQGDRTYFVEQGLVDAGRTWLVESVGVDPQRFRPQPEPEGTPVVLLAARMLWDKGVGVLAEAARILKSQGVPVRVVLVGLPDPGNPASIPEEQLRAWEAEDLLEWWKWRDDMEAVFARSHIVTLPSFSEGVPTVLLEAAACARPLVASDIPGCRAVITPGENGLLVPVRDAQALADALVRLLRSPALRRKMGRAARQSVLRKFTHQQVNAATIAVYEHLLSERDAPSTE